MAYILEQGLEGEQEKEDIMYYCNPRHPGI
jgi:hypothetical protein